MAGCLYGDARVPIVPREWLQVIPSQPIEKVKRFADWDDWLPGCLADWLAPWVGGWMDGWMYE